MQAVGNVENGKTDLSISHAIDYADALQKNYHQILNIESVTTYNQTATGNSGGNNILNAETIHLEGDKKN